MEVVGSGRGLVASSSPDLPSQRGENIGQFGQINTKAAAVYANRVNQERP